MKNNHKYFLIFVLCSLLTFGSSKSNEPFIFDATEIEILNDGNQIRTSIGVGVDWLTPIGPLNFSLTEVITKSDTDIEESFRFNLGTTF